MGVIVNTKTKILTQENGKLQDLIEYTDGLVRAGVRSLLTRGNHHPQR